MMVFPEILKQLEINEGIIKVQNSYQLFKSFQKDPRLIILNYKLQINSLLDHFTNDKQLAKLLQNFGQQYDLHYLNQEILLYTIISHLRENQILVQSELTDILQDTGFQQFYSDLSQVHEGTAGKLISKSISDMVDGLNSQVQNESSQEQNILIPKQELQELEQNSLTNTFKVQNIKLFEQVQRALEYCLRNQMALPEIFKYFDYSSKQLTIRANLQFELKIKELEFEILNEFPLTNQSLFEQLVKMIELILLQRDQIEQKKLKNFLQIIPDLCSYFNYFIQNINENNFQDENQEIDENIHYENQNQNHQLAKKAIQYLQEIQQLSENLAWKELKREYLIKMLNYTAQIGQPLPQILGSLDLVESELTLKVDKSLIKFLKTSKLYYNPKQNICNLQEKELIFKLLDILSQEIIDPDVSKQLEEQLQSVYVRNLYANLKQLKLKKYLQYFNKLYNCHEKIDQVTLIYRKVKAVYLHYISSNEILVPELIKYIRIKKVRRNKDENAFFVHLNVNSQLIDDFGNNPGLRSLNDQCRISTLLSKEAREENCKILDTLRFKQKIKQIQSQLQEQLIFDAVTTIHRHHQSIVKDLHLIFQYGVVISTMNQFQNYFQTNIDTDSYISKVYHLLSQMNEFVNRQFQNEQIIFENPEFHYNLANYNNSESTTVLTKKTKIIQNRNIRKMLYYMIQKQVVFPEFINFLQIVDKAKRHLLQLNKGIELVHLIENDRKIQQFMNLCLNGEEALFNQIKLADFEKLPSKKEVDTNSYESHEQSSIINILQILFNQKEIHSESLKYFNVQFMK